MIFWDFCIFKEKKIIFPIFKKFLSIVQNFPIQCFPEAYSIMQHSPTNHPEASVCLFHDFGFLGPKDLKI